MAHFTAIQRAQIRRATSRPDAAAEAAHDSGELNLVPFLDIVTNVMMFLLATIATVFTARVPVPVPSGSSDPAAPERLTVQIVESGYVVAATGGYLQPGCTTLGPAVVAVPLRLGQHDARGLTDCLAAARAQPEWHASLASQRTIQVAAHGAIPYFILLRTLDAAREIHPGARDLFPEPRLGILD